jgi:hypothetical protein
MTEMFEKIFEEVMTEMNINSWYELYDSEKFEIVRERIAKAMNITVEELDENAEYNKWDEEMYWEL